MKESTERIPEEKSNKIVLNEKVQQEIISNSNLRRDNFLFKTRQSKRCGFSIYTFDNLKSKSVVRLVRAEKMVLSGLVFARKIARMILNQNI